MGAEAERPRAAPDQHSLSARLDDHSCLLTCKTSLTAGHTFCCPIYLQTQGKQGYLTRRTASLTARTAVTAQMKPCLVQEGVRQQGLKPPFKKGKELLGSPMSGFVLVTLSGRRGSRDRTASSTWPFVSSIPSSPQLTGGRGKEPHHWPRAPASCSIPPRNQTRAAAHPRAERECQKATSELPRRVLHARGGPSASNPDSAEALQKHKQTKTPSPGSRKITGLPHDRHKLYQQDP